MANPRILVGASTGPVRPVVRRISPSDLYDSLARGVDDFVAMPSHAIFLCVIYPMLGIFLIALTMASTFALSRPSEKFGTHSTRVDIRRKNIRLGCRRQIAPEGRWTASR